MVCFDLKMATGDPKHRYLTSISDLHPGMKNVTCVFIVIDKGTTSQTKDGSVVRKCRVADQSASIGFSLWNEQADAIEEGDILRLTKGYASLWKGGMVLYSGKYGVLQKIGEFTMLYTESPDMSEVNREFTVQASHEQQTRGKSDSRGTWNRWSEGNNGRLDVNKNGNNHIAVSGNGSSNEGSTCPPSHQSMVEEYQYCPPHNHVQHKTAPGNYHTEQGTDHAPLNDYHDNHQHPPSHIRGGGGARGPGRSRHLVHEGVSHNGYERDCHVPRGGHWEGQPHRSRGDAHMGKLRPYQRRPGSSVSLNFREQR